MQMIRCPVREVHRRGVTSNLLQNLEAYLRRWFSGVSFEVSATGLASTATDRRELSARSRLPEGLLGFSG